MDTDERMAAARSLERRAAFVCLSTLGEAGFPETRMLFNLKHFASRRGGGELAAPFSGMEEDFSTYIGTNTSSRKTSQIRADSRVCLYYSDSRFYRGLGVMGRLEEVSDRNIHRALWRKGWESYYPAGPEDPDFAVFRFRAGKARYYRGLAVLEIDCAKVGAEDGSEGH